MKFPPKVVRFLLSMVVVVTLYVERPPTMRREVFFLLLLGALTIANLALSWGQQMARTRSASAPTTPGAAAAARGAGASGAVRKRWLLVAMGFVGATGLGIVKAHETGIWLFIAVGILVGASFSYFVLTRVR
jgi:hypothetical protein